MKRCPRCGYVAPPKQRPKRKKRKKRVPKIVKQKKERRYKDHHNDMDWNKKRAEIIRRDDYKCMRCDKKPGADKLTVHHIKPRSKGGGDYSSNLITLCVHCHDWVEPRDLYSASEIIGSYPEPIEEPQPTIKKKKATKFQDVPYRPHWSKPIKKKRRKNTVNYQRIYGPIYELAQMSAQGYRMKNVDLYGSALGMTAKRRSPNAV